MDTSSQSRYNDIRNIPQRSTSNETSLKPGFKKEGSKATSGPELSAVSTSKIDVDEIPIYKPVGKPITQVDIDKGVVP